MIDSFARWTAILSPALLCAFAAVRQLRAMRATPSGEIREIDELRRALAFQYLAGLVTLALLFFALYAIAMVPKAEVNDFFFCVLSEGLLFQLMAGFFAASVVAGPLAVSSLPSQVDETTMSEFLRLPVRFFRTEGRRQRAVALVVLAVGVLLSLLNYRATENFFRVSPHGVHVQAFFDCHEEELKASDLSRVVLFQRRGGKFGKIRNRESLILVTKSGRVIDEFSLVDGRAQEALLAIRRVMPEVAVERRDLVRVFAGEILEGL